MKRREGSRGAGLTAVFLAAALLLAAPAWAGDGFFDFVEETEGAVSAASLDPASLDLSQEIALSIEYGTDVPALLEKFKPVFDGANVKLKVTGSGPEYLAFLTGCDFAGLELDLADQFGDLYYSDEEVTLKASDIPNLVSLSFGEDRNHEAELMGPFPALQHLTVRIEGWGCSYFGRLGSDKLPALRSVRVDYADESVEENPGFGKSGLIFPHTLESVEVYREGEALGADSTWNKSLLGGLMACCPDASVNGKSQDEIAGWIRDSVPEEDREKTEEELEGAKANSAVYELYHSAVTDAAPWSGAVPDYTGGLVIASIEDDGVEVNSVSAIRETGAFYDIPPEALAKSWDEAGTVAIVERELTLVGYYTMGNAYRTTTNLILMNAATGDLYAKDTIAVNEPPQTIEVQTINGAPLGGNGYGDFEFETAVSMIAGRVGTGPSEGAQEGEQAEGGAQTSSGPAVPGEDLTAQVLDALGNDTYRSVREFLKGGETIGSGYHGDPGAGLQQLLSDMGCALTIDGAVGQQTIGALNQVQENFGMPVTESVDLQQFDRLLPLLLMTRDEERADELLRAFYEDSGGYGYYDYLKGSAYWQLGRYYAAKEAFALSGYGDSTARGQACEQPWPENGEIWHNPDVPGSDVGLTITVNSYDESLGRCYHMYTQSGTLTAVLFITGSGSVTTYVPAGTYRIKDASGKAWYGKTDAFGREGYYEFLSFNDDPETRYDATLNPGSYELTINVTESNEDADGVGSTSSDWEDWV